MSTVRRLLQKSSSAPPQRLTLPNHGSVEEQLAAIDAQRERTSVLDAKLANFFAKVADQKAASRAERHLRQWLVERGTLSRERSQLQRDLDEQLTRVSAAFAPESKQGAHSDAPVSVAVASVLQEWSNDCASTHDIATATLTSVLSLKAKIATMKHKTRRSARDDKEVQHALDHLRKYLEEELAVLSAACGAGFDHDGMSKMLQGLVADAPACAVEEKTDGGSFLNDLRSNAERSIENALSEYPNHSVEAVSIFRAAICASLDEARAAIEACRAEMQEAICPSQVTKEDLEVVEALMKAYDPARNRTRIGKPNEELYDRIAHDRPHLTVLAAQGAVRYLLAQRAARHKLTNVEQRAQDATARLLQSLTAVLKAENDQWIYQQDLVAAQEAAAEMEACRAAEVEQLRAEYEVREAEKQAAAAAERAKEEAKNAVTQARRKREYEQRLAELARHHAEKCMAEAERARLEEEVRVLREQEAAARSLYDAERIEVRRREWQAKVDALKLQQLLAEAEATRKEEEYAAFFAQVAKNLGVERDSLRVLQATASSGASEAGYIGAREAAQRKMTGFSMETLLQDPRFKIHEALVAANLHQTAYARQVLSSQYRVAPAQRPSAENPLLSS